MRLWFVLVLFLASPAEAASFSDGGNTFLSYQCSTSGLYSPNCAEYPHPSIPEPVTARGVVNGAGAFDVDYFNSGLFGGFFAEDLSLPYESIQLAVQLPTLLGSELIEYGVGITQAERSHGDPFWSTTLFDVQWVGAEWVVTSHQAGPLAPQVVGNVVYFWTAEYPTGAGTTIATIFGGRSAAPFQALGLALVPEPSAVLLLVAVLGVLAARRAARQAGCQRN